MHTIVTRFAPSPTGFLHLGHAHAALIARRLAREADGRFLLRIENIDAARCRPEYEAAILEDLAWLGIDWDGPARRQSDHLSAYGAVLDALRARDLLYPCFCTRAEIARSGIAQHGPDGPIYPGTCAHLLRDLATARIAAGAPHCWRLQFNSGNITQPLYLTMNVTVAVTVALFLTRTAIPYRGIMSAYLLSGYCAVGLAFWQFASRLGGIPYPSDVLYSNPGWAIVEQSMGSIPRIQGPFSEPAGLAFYLSGLCFCCLWMTARGHRMMRINLLLPLSILATLLSTSTTGIVVLGVGMPATLLLAALRGNRATSARMAKNTAILVLGSLLVLGPLFVLKPALLDAVGTVVNATMTKTDGDSYNDRTGLDTAALATLSPTYGLGVGWGSFRTSSLVPGIVANAGLFGVAMVLWLFARVAKLAGRARSAVPDHPASCVIDGFSAALCGQLGAALLSAPTIGSLGFFLQLGCLVGAAARMAMDARTTRSFRTATYRVSGPVLAPGNGT